MRNPFSKWSLVDRISYGVLGLTTLVMLIVGLWEIAAPFGAGHVAVLPARAIMADNMVTYGILYPVRAYSNQAPDIAQAYAHHPWGTYYLFGLTRLVFGRHEWAIRIVPVCLNVGMPSLLFFVAHRLWGKVAGAAAALGWVVLPITLAFAQFPAFETFSLAGMLAVTLSGLRFAETRSSRRWVELLCVSFLAANTDWIASLYVLATAATVLFLLVFDPRRNVPDAHLRSLLRGALSSALVVLAVIALYVYLFREIGLYDDFLGSADHRAQGNDLPLTEVLKHRRYWLELMFTKLGFWIAGVGTLVSLGRLFAFRRMTELLPLLLTLVATIHYVHFKNGADVHIYWPLPFAGTLALSLAVLTRTLEDALVLWRTRRDPQEAAASVSRDARAGQRGASLWALGTVGAVALGLFPDALRALDYARDSGCRLNDDGQLNLQDYDKVAALEHFKRLVPKGQRVMLQSSMWPNWSQDYALERPTVVRSSLRGPNPTGAHHALFDLRYAPSTTLSWAQSLKHEVIGPFLYVDSMAPGNEGPVLGFQAQSPGWFRRYFVQAHDPIYGVVADPYRTWEHCAHLATSPNPVPSGLDRPEHRRIAHNVAVEQRNVALAAQLRAALESTLDRSSARQYRGGTRLLGHRLLPTVPPRLEVYFLAAGPLSLDSFFDVRSRVLAAPFGSWVSADDKEKRYGTNFEFHPGIWKAGFIYVSEVEVRERPGRERFYGLWLGASRPRPETGAELIALFERP
jgi:4-amino-4-deoxy-L-arabinose transferase-like glycosyltransferase